MSVCTVKMVSAFVNSAALFVGVGIVVTVAAVCWLLLAVLLL